MKRFAWKLQRVLDVTAQRERVLRGDLLALGQTIAGVRESILRRQAELRTVLGDLARQAAGVRLAEQAIFMACVETEKRFLEALRVRLAQLEAQREEKRQAFLRTRATRRGLERLRAEARAQHLREAGRREQTDFDEAAHVAYARA